LACMCAWVGAERTRMRMRTRLMVCARVYVCVRASVCVRALACVWNGVCGSMRVGVRGHGCACSACMTYPSLDAGMSCTNVRPSRRITCNGRSSRGLQRAPNKQANKQTSRDCGARARKRKVATLRRAVKSRCRCGRGCPDRDRECGDCCSPAAVYSAQIKDHARASRPQARALRAMDDLD
jgi:hypothetical protein